MRAPLALVALCCVARAQVVPYDGADRHKIIVHNTGSEDLGFYYLGNGYDPGPEVAMWDGSETLNAIIEPGGEAGRFVSFSDAFAVRSAEPLFSRELSTPEARSEWWTSSMDVRLRDATPGYGAAMAEWAGMNVGD